VIIKTFNFQFPVFPCNRVKVRSPPGPINPSIWVVKDIVIAQSFQMVRCIGWSVASHVVKNNFVIFTWLCQLKLLLKLIKIEFKGSFNIRWKYIEPVFRMNFASFDFALRSVISNAGLLKRKFSMIFLKMSWRIVGCLGETSFVKIDMTHQSHESLQMTKGFDLCMSGLKGSRYQNGLNDYNTRYYTLSKPR